jgi:hypothetical protein
MPVPIEANRIGRLAVAVCAAREAGSSKMVLVAAAPAATPALRRIKFRLVMLDVLFICLPQGAIIVHLWEMACPHQAHSNHHRVKWSA